MQIKKKYCLDSYIPVCAARKPTVMFYSFIVIQTVQATTTTQLM